VISIIRLRSLVGLASTHNVTHDYFDVSIWSSVEVTVGIICACMPTVRQALARVLPSVFGGSSVKHYYNSNSAGMPSKTRGSAAAAAVRAGYLPRIGGKKDPLDSASSEGTRLEHGGDAALRAYRLEGPTAGSASVLCEGGPGTRTPSSQLSVAYRSAHAKSGSGKLGGIVVFQERSVQIGDAESDHGDGDGESRNSDRGDEVELVKMKNLSGPRSSR
jgi:hypothetical protein